MKRHPRFSLLVVSIIAAVLVGSLVYVSGRASQDDEKSLNIARFANEPLELVELKIDQRSVKSLIKSKFKDQRSQVGVDDVKFRGRDNWAKNVKVTLRNISDRQIYGLSVSLFFEHSSSRTAFEIPLKRAQSKDLTKHPLQPGDEIDLEVADTSFDETMTKILQYGLNPNELAVSLYVNSANFSDDFGWFKGRFMRRDPNNHQKWDAVDKPGPPGGNQSFHHPEASRLKKPAGFTLISLKSPSFFPQSLQTCQENVAGSHGYVFLVSGN